MLFTVKDVMCTAKSKPKAWAVGENSGVSYKVDLGDGEGNLKLPVLDEQTWSIFEPFKMFDVVLEVNQTARDNRLATTLRIVEARLRDK